MAAAGGAGGPAGGKDDEEGVPDTEGYHALTHDYEFMGGPPPEPPPPPPERASSSEDEEEGEAADGAKKRGRTKILFSAMRQFVANLPRVDVWNVRSIPKDRIVDFMGSTFEFASTKQLLSDSVVFSFAGGVHGEHSGGVMNDVFVRYFGTLFEAHWEKPRGAWVWMPIADPKPPEETFVPKVIEKREPESDTPFARAQVEAEYKKAVVAERKRHDEYIANGKKDEVKRVKRMEQCGRVLLRLVLGDKSGALRRMMANAPMSPVVIRYLLDDPKEFERVELLDLELFDSGKASELRQLLVGCRSPFMPPRGVRLNRLCLPEDLREQLDTQIKGPKLPDLPPVSEEDIAEIKRKKKGAAVQEAIDALVKEREDARLSVPTEVYDRESVAHEHVCIALYKKGQPAVIEYINRVCRWEMLARRRKGLDSMKRGFQSVSLLQTTLRELDADSVAEAMHQGYGVPLSHHAMKRHVRQAFNWYGAGPLDPLRAAEEEAGRKRKIWV
mmetsp:Transcript_11134/g.38773  ORF Transcript_11134/g.38773 Transcript_11134/m.38773 type:complete len:500 (-) Transcript_11134:35-1534(-)